MMVASGMHVTTRYTHAHNVPHAEHVRNLEKMAKWRQDELEDFDDVSESMYFLPEQYPRPYCFKVHSNGQSTLPVEGPNIFKKKLTFGEEIPWNDTQMTFAYPPH